MGCKESREEADDDENQTFTRRGVSADRYGSTGKSKALDNNTTTDRHGHAAAATTSSSSASYAGERSNTPLTVSAKPLGQFSFLERSYSIKTPSCLVPRINELFKSICDRYDVAVVNREKVDEALTLFKQVVGVERHTSMEVSFLAWKECLTAPKFTVSFKPDTGDVKDVRVRAEIIPKEKRKGLKHMRDLLDACHLFLQQKDFLQRQIHADMIELESLAPQLQSLAREAGLSNSEKKQLPRTYMAVKEQFSTFSGVLDMFFAHIYSLMNEINSSVHVLEARESSVER